MDKNYRINHWSFGNLEENSELVYKISPKTSGDYELVSVWFNPSGFSMEKLNLNVKF